MAFWIRFPNQHRTDCDLMQECQSCSHTVEQVTALLPRSSMLLQEAHQGAMMMILRDQKVFILSFISCKELKQPHQSTQDTTCNSSCVCTTLIFAMCDHECTTVINFVFLCFCDGWAWKDDDDELYCIALSLIVWHRCFAIGVQTQWQWIRYIHVQLVYRTYK